MRRRFVIVLLSELVVPGTLSEPCRSRMQARRLARHTVVGSGYSSLLLHSALNHINCHNSGAGRLSNDWDKYSYIDFDMLLQD